MDNRKIMLEGIDNCRELGGLKTTTGFRICTGMLLRSARLTRATETDVVQLRRKYRLSQVIDLRTSVEIAEEPDVRMKGVVYSHIPIFDERKRGISHEKETDAKPQPPNMEELYIMLASDEVCRRNLGEAVRTVMTHDFSRGSVLWHCTEGKDRCGLVTALLLLALETSRETVMADYLLTNAVNQAKAEAYYQRVLAHGQGEAVALAVRDVFLAKESYLDAVFTVIDEEYGNDMAYLRNGLGIHESEVLRFRKRVLEV